MSVVNDLIDDLIDEHKVLPNTLLIQHSAIVSEDFHHSIQEVHDEGGRYVVLCSGHEEDPKLLGIEEVDSLHTLYLSQSEEFELQNMGEDLLART